MKTHSFLKHINRYNRFVLFSLFIGLLFSYCSKEPAVGTRLNQDQPTVYDYLLSNPDKYSEFAKLIELTKTVDLLKGLKNLTFLLPDNTAMQQYYKDKKVNSLADFTDDFRQSLLRNHIIPSMQKTADIYLGALQDTNALGDYLETEFGGSDILLNKTSKIISRNITVAGNLIQVIDKVLDPVTKDIYTLISEDPAYSIFTEGLQLTGLKDTLQLITYPYNAKKVRTRFTMLAVADTTYNRLGINDINDLITWCGESSADFTSKEHPLYKYLEYHCLTGTLYLNYFMDQTKYSAISQVNSISMSVTNDYKINLDNATNKYTGFIIPSCNITAKNGVIHAVNNLLPLPALQEFIFETTDYFEIKQGLFYRKAQKEWIDGQNSFSKIKFVSDKLQYIVTSSPSENYLNGDYLQLPNFKWIEITTPEIPAGHYKISSKMWFTFTGAFPKVNVYIDDKYLTELTENQQIADFGTVNWKTSGEHRIKIECPDLGTMAWDYLVFTPIKE
jgi:uncharacterized surface protein with fasciclin (FAS1) repeats